MTKELPFPSPVVTIERDGDLYRVGIRLPDGRYDPKVDVLSQLPLIGAEEHAANLRGPGDIGDQLEVEYRFLDEPKPPNAEA